MPMLKRSNSVAPYASLRGDVTRLVAEGRSASARLVNVVMTATYWRIGRRIVVFEQQGKRRAGYAEKTLARLSVDLTRRFGRGLSETNVRQFRAFYSAFPISKSKVQIQQTPSAEFRKQQTVSAVFKNTQALGSRGQTVSSLSEQQALGARFPLPWSAYVRLLAVKSGAARQFGPSLLAVGSHSCRCGRPDQGLHPPLAGAQPGDDRDVDPIDTGCAATALQRRAAHDADPLL